MQGQDKVLSILVLIDLSLRKDRCKHLCCREGVDKMPKPPKGSFVAAPELVDASTLPKKDHAKTSTVGRAQRESQGSIECFDLTSRNDAKSNGQSTNESRQSLERLHQKLVKSPSVPVVAQRKGLQAFSQKRESSLSFLRDTAEEEEKHGPSPIETDLDDFPSPSALFELETDHNVRSLAPTQKLHFREKEVSSTPQVPETQHGLNPTSEPSEGDEMTDVEAAMIGLTDTMILQEPKFLGKSAVGPSLDATLKHPDPTSSLLTTKSLPIDNSTAFKTVSIHSGQKSESEFQVARTLPQPPANVEKRPLADIPTDNALHAPPKKPRLDREEHARHVPQILPEIHADNSETSNAVTAVTAPPPPPIIKPGQPVWVYEMDPAFIAQFQDFVEFV